MRDNGKLIEAHEVFNNQRYEQGGDVMTGILGAVTQAMQGVNYGSHGERQIGDDFASGVVAQNPEQGLSPAEAMIMLMLTQKK